MLVFKKIFLSLTILSIVSIFSLSRAFGSQILQGFESDMSEDEISHDLPKKTLTFPVISKKDFHYLHLCENFFSKIDPFEWEQEIEIVYNLPELYYPRLRKTNVHTLIIDNRDVSKLYEEIPSMNLHYKAKKSSSLSYHNLNKINLLPLAENTNLTSLSLVSCSFAR